MWIGRLYDGLQSGRPVGEAMMRLQELGVISGDTRNQIENLQKSARKAMPCGRLPRPLSASSRAT